MRFTTNKIIATGLVGLTLIATTLYADDKKVVATVNGVEITQETLDAVSGMVSRSTQGEKVDSKALLDDLIVTELARQEANKAGLAERDEVKNKVKDFTDKLVLNLWTQEQAASFKPSDDELKKAYEERTSGDNKYEYKARHILMKTQEEAAAVIKELESGVDFADLAKKKSTSRPAQRVATSAGSRPNPWSSHFPPRSPKWNLAPSARNRYKPSSAGTSSSWKNAVMSNRLHLTT